MAQCTAQRHHGRGRCRKHAVAGKTVCRLHGGLSLSGEAHPNFKHGRYSKDVQKAGGKFAADFQRSLDDPDSTSLRHEIALVQAIISDLMEKTPPTTPRGRSQLLRAVESLRKISKAQTQIEKMRTDTMNAKEAGAFVGAIHAAIMTEVDDPAVRDRIAKRFREILSPHASNESASAQLPQALLAAPEDVDFEIEGADDQ